MSLNIEHALKYMFKDTEWKMKFLIGSIFMIGMLILNIMNKLLRLLDNVKPEQIEHYMKIMPAILVIGGILFIISTILNIFSTGYFAKNTNLRIFKPESNLLEWNNWTNMFFAGFKANIAVLIYCFTFCLVCCIPILLIIILSINLNKMALIIAVLVSISLIFIASITFMFLIAAATLAFNTDLKFSSYFNLGLMKKIITKDFLGFFIYVILICSISILANIINSILMITIVGIVFMPVIYFYQYLVQNELAAQFIRETLNLPIKE